VSPEDPPPLASDTARILEIGMALWFVALVVSVLVPALHQGDRAWWPWTCVAGIAEAGATQQGQISLRDPGGQRTTPAAVPEVAA